MTHKASLFLDDRPQGKNALDAQGKKRLARFCVDMKQGNRKETMKQGNNAKKTQRGKLTDERKIYAINN